MTFGNCFNKFSIAGAQVLDSIYHMALYISFEIGFLVSKRYFVLCMLPS